MNYNSPYKLLKNLPKKLDKFYVKNSKYGLKINQDGVKRSAKILLSYPNIEFEQITNIWPNLREVPTEIIEQLVVDATYSGYLERQEADIVAFRKDENLILSTSLNYNLIGGLSNEVKEKLSKAMPTTLGAAARISGVTPAALTTLLRYVKRKDKKAVA